MNAKAVEPALNLLADLDEVGSFDHDVHGSDDFRLRQRPNVKICTGRIVSSCMMQFAPVSTHRAH